MDYFKLDKDFFTSITVAYSKVDEEGNNIYGIHGNCDHPAFTALREYLGANGFIEIQRRWINGDRVLKEFMLNDVHFEIGDQFSCASAQDYAQNPRPPREKKVVDFFPDI